jgi:DNA topoisomerase VI subunit A
LRELLAGISAKYPSLPMVSFTDSNSSGLKIMSVLNDGSVGLYHESANLAARRIKHLGCFVEEAEE